MDRGDFLPPNPWLASGESRKLRYRIRKALRQLWASLWRSVVWLFRLQMVVIVAVVVVGMLVSTLDTVRQRAQPLPDVPANIRRVYGFGINPTDGVLYAATDQGLFQIESEDSALRIRSSRQALLGFQVVGEDTFIAGGTPDILDQISGQEPKLRGLVRSTDAGRSWHAIALSGEAGITALDLEHDTMYAFDSESNSLIVSKNGGKTWETRGSPQEPLAGLVVSPSDPERLIGTSELGVVQESRDGGFTWQKLDWEPYLYLSWEEPARLWAATEDLLQLSTDGGLTWTSKTVPGPMDAFSDQGSELYASANVGDIFVSSDDGLTWQLRYRNPPEEQQP